MALEPGTPFGSYEVAESIGSGGMGEVYRAKDTDLKREVALKVLPPAFVEDADRLARFQREAEILASLNHPNIAQVYGLEKADGTTAIVMELVEGPTLADRIKEGPIPPDEAMGIALQIVAGLEAAHEKQIVHRDLKPANVKVRDDGTVKVLDFGISKPIDPTAISGAPVMTTPAVTQTGVILGTAAYMSPEQAQGKFVDQRTDIWAFGCLLFEMLTGQPAFGGENVMTILARVIDRDTDLSSMPGTISPAVRHTLKLCLEKDPRKRIADIRDVRLALVGTFESELGSPVTIAVSSSVWKRVLVPTGAVLAGAAMMALVGLALSPEPVPAQIDRWAYSLPESQGFRSVGRSIVSLSPDGRRFVYNATDGLYVRPMDALEAQRLPGTEESLSSPFFSPDGQAVAYWDSGQLKRLALTGGAPIVIADGVTNPTGASWASDGTIVFGQPEGIFRVSAAGGTPELVIPAEDGERLYGPQLMPNGDLVLFSANALVASWDTAQIAVQSLSTGERTGLISGGSDARYLESGHLVYALGDGLFAVALDPGTLSLTGGPVSLVQGILRAPLLNQAAANYEISQDGTLIYARSTSSVAFNNLGGQNTFVWVDRSGNEDPLPFDPCFCASPVISPDGSRVALQVAILGEIATADVWIWSVAQRTRARLTFEEGIQFAPLWTPDGAGIVYQWIGEGLFLRAADGTGMAEQLLEANTVEPWTWAGDDELIYAEDTGSSGWDIGVLTLSDREVRPLLATEFNEYRPALSPDGRWLAYQSDESGQPEIYVRPYPDIEAGRWLVSSDGGQEPKWSRDGRRLFFMSPTGLMETDVSETAPFNAQTPTVALSAERYVLLNAPAREYDVSPDGEQFLVIQQNAVMSNDGEPATPPEIVVVKHWVEELKRRVPTE